jgi:NAD(P)-dependent dehydrogenase (short-subunit alcohol dehydrogenase family)
VDLKNKVGIVTGGSQGIGKTTVLFLVGLGAKVVVLVASL